MAITELNIYECIGFEYEVLNNPELNFKDFEQAPVKNTFITASLMDLVQINKSKFLNFLA